MYTPRIPPSKPEDLLPYLDDEFGRVAAVVNDGLAGQWEIRYVVPPKRKPGMVVYADGVKWNPGSGEGLYRYTLAGIWKFIG